MTNGIGSWHASVKESLLDVEPANDLISDHSVLLTRRGTTLYVHLHRQPIIDAVYLHPIVELPRRVTVLNAAAEIQTDVADLPWLHQKQPSRCLGISHLPVNRGSLVGWVIKLEFDQLSDAQTASDAVADTDQGIAGAR